MTMLLLFLFAILAVYTVYMLRLALAWYMQPQKHFSSRNAQLSVTVIIPVRNEENTISPCLEALLLQDYQPAHWELIVSDDHSDDHTREVVSSFIPRFKAAGVQMQLITATDDGIGKKAALERAISLSNGKLIMTSDADTVMGNKWIRTVASFHAETGAAMIVPMTELDPGNSFFSGIQAVEFAALNAAGAASLISGKPLLCNGANLAFTKEAFYRAGGYSGGGQWASGDDTFLMLTIHAKAPGSVLFLKDPAAVVTAAPVVSWYDFLHQRIRWISKVKHYRTGYPSYTGVMVAMANLSLVILLTGWLSGSFSIWALVSGFLIKISGELALLFQVLPFIRRQRLLLLILPAAIMVPFYFILSGRYLMFPSGFKWKGRSYRS